MGNALLCWPNRALEASYSGGSWQTSLSNLNSRQSYKAIISNGTSLSSTKFSGVFVRDRFVRIFCVYRHNLSTSATIRITLYNAFGTVVYNSGWVDAWPSVFLPTQLEWEYDNYWSGKVDPETVENIPHSTVLLLPQSYFAHSYDVEINDVGNIEGYISVGKMIAAPQWQPATNITYGAKVGWEDPSGVSSSLNGEEFFTEKMKFRTAVFQLDFMDEVEGTNMAMGLTGSQGITKEVFFVFDPDNALLLQQRSFNGRLRELSPLEYPNYGITGMGFSIKEVL